MRKGQDQVQRAHGPGEAEQGHEHQARAYHPGDLVYYKRHQAPAEGRSHQKLDVPRRQISRWFGPARILGLETKVTYEGQVRQPHRMAWLISQGRLKRVHTDQLRHASKREKLTNEEFHDILATPWTFTDVTSVLDKGTYDDLVELPHLQRGRPHDVKPRRSPSRGRGGQKRANSTSRPRSAPPTKAKTEETVMNDRPPSEPYEPSIAEEFMPDDQDLPPVPSDDDLEGPEEVDLDRLLGDPHYMPRMEPGPPTGPLFEHEPFQRARARHERDEAQRMKSMLSRGSAGAAMLVQEETFEDNLIYAITLPMPETAAQWKAIVKDPAKFVGKQVAKGVEVSWHKLNKEQREAMTEAKRVEIKEWVASKVCRAAIGEVDPERIMKMR